MAAQQILFKIACPSCEAQVPIRDSRLLGKKVECPKCKFRFVVDEPTDEADEQPKAKKARPKKKANNGPLMIGLGVGGLAVVVLGVVGFFLFFNEPEKPKATTPPQQPPVALSNAERKPENTQPTNADDHKDKAGATPTATADAAASTPATSRGVAQPVPPAGTVTEISNLLPNDAQLVVNIYADKLRFSTLGEQLFESRIGFRQGLFKEKLGFGIEDIKRIIHAENPELKWTFNVLEMMKPVNIKALEKAMGFTKGANSPIKGREYYEIPANDVMDNLAAGVKTELEARGERFRKADDTTGVMGLMQVDEVTLVIATLDQLKSFLEADAKQRHQTIPTKRGDQDGNPVEASPSPSPKPRGSSYPYAFAPEPLAMQVPGGDPNDPNLTENATFLTIDPPLKAMFDRLESDPKTKPILTVVMHMQADPNLRRRLQSWTGIGLLGNLPMKVFGMTLTKYELERFYGMTAAEFFNENDVKELETILKKQLPIMAQALGLYLGGIKIETEGADAVQQPSGGGGGVVPGGSRPGGGGGGGGQPSFPGVNPTEEGPTSKLKLARRSHYLMLTAELNLVQRAFDRIYAFTAGTVAKMRGMVDMSAKVPDYGRLADAAMKLRDTGTIPKATFPMAEGMGGRLARNWPPHYRVSWMAALLPHLGHDDLYKNIERDKSWRSDNNIKSASILVPAFLDPRYPDQSWYAKIDALGNRSFGATHYVGMAGVGQDIADFNPALEKDEKRKAEMMKKIGPFGYDRVTSVKDITDGLNNTIFMISVPPGYQRPWMAGGGATCQGVPETRSIRPFVYNHGGKKGAFVLMLDGQVRFIAEDINNDVFKALCTIKGEERIEDLEKIAPKYKPGSKAEMKTEKEKEDEEKDKP